jgi:hypothetical protein
MHHVSEASQDVGEQVAVGVSSFHRESSSRIVRSCPAGDRASHPCSTNAARTQHAFIGARLIEARSPRHHGNIAARLNLTHETASHKPHSRFIGASCALRQDLESGCEVSGSHALHRQRASSHAITRVARWMM